MPDGDSHSSLFPDRDSRLLHIWDRMQRLQAEFCIHQELCVYFTSPQWRSARTVLDVGTGNGFYLGKLVETFPDKTYGGIDSSRPLLAIASRELRERAIELRATDLAGFEPAESFDFVLMRLLLQHVSSVPEALEQAARFTAPGGALLVIDALDEERFFDPPATAFNELFEAYIALQERQGHDRQVGARVQDALAASDDWSLARRARLVIPSTIPANRKLFEENYGLFLDLVEMTSELDYDYDMIRRQWHAWCGLERAYMQVGLDILLLERR